jgi:hypothetical protein
MRIKVVVRGNKESEAGRFTQQGSVMEMGKSNEDL